MIFSKLQIREETRSSYNMFLFRLLGISLLLLNILLLSCSEDSDNTVNVSQERTETTILDGKKIYFLDSYHESYPPRTLTRNAFEKKLSGQGISIRYEYLNAKIDKDPKILAETSLAIRDRIREWNPDCIIAADDAINKYLISPYLKDSPIPVIFIGVNWTIEEYGYPTDNITGQIEVELFEQLLNNLRSHSSGNRVGLLTGDTLTDRKNVEIYKEILGDDLVKTVLVNEFNEWKEAFIQIQEDVDILFLRHINGISDWNQSEAEELVYFKTKIPTGTVHNEMKELAMVCFPKMDEEYGEYAAETAVQILSGSSPSAIPVSKNKRSKVLLNMNLAKGLSIKFSSELMEIATLIGSPRWKILYVNSYHEGYEWSDGIEKGLIEALEVSEESTGFTGFRNNSLELRIQRMDTKLNHSESFKERAASEALSLIKSWKPDIVIVSDDNAAKYLVSPHLMDSPIPIIFCGVNWDASVYGFPTDNITGMVEVTPYEPLFEEIKKHADGDRVGILSSSSLSANRELQYLKSVIGEDKGEVIQVKTFNEWKKAFLKFQQTVDYLLIFSQVGIDGWNEEEARQFVMKNGIIPSGSTLTNTAPLALVTFARVSEEQGWWSGKRALDIINGKSVSDIAVARNIQHTLFLNMDIAGKLGIIFPLEMLNDATLINDATE